MKKISTTLLFFLALSFTSMSQNVHIISLDAGQLNIENRNFYIARVVDKRVIQSSLGIVQKGPFNKKVIATFEKPLENVLLDFFNQSLPKNGQMQPIELVVIKLDISERTSFTSEVAYADLSIEFYHNNTLLFSTYEQTESSGIEVTAHHGDNIKDVLVKAIYTFSSANWQSKIPASDPKSINPDYFPINNESSTSSLQDRPSTHTLDVGFQPVVKNRNVTAVGYQIGGLTLIGVNYEFRVHDIFGLHVGAGLYGWTAGIKLHTNDNKNSPFFNISTKDGGLGLINLTGIEYGGRLVFSQKKDIALHSQIGIARLAHIDSEFEYEIFGVEGAPDWWLTLGIGISW